MIKPKHLTDEQWGQILADDAMGPLNSMSPAPWQGLVILVGIVICALILG
jgi:hypothetical protein